MDDHTHTKPISKNTLLDEIERIIRRTDKSYGYQHLSIIGQGLRDTFSDYDPGHYGHKNLRSLVEAHPERFTMSHRGRAQFWVRLSTEPKRKEGYADSNARDVSTTKPKPRLMTEREFNKLCDWLMGSKGCNFQPDPKSPEGVKWKCDGSLRKTRQWLRRRDFLSLESNSKLLRQLGGRCDCEVIFNLRGNWVAD
jgi:hypothetical protein